MSVMFGIMKQLLFDKSPNLFFKIQSVWVLYQMGKKGFWMFQDKQEWIWIRSKIASVWIHAKQ